METLRRLSLLTLLLSFTALSAYAQQGEAVFESTEHDFGTIPEGKSVQHVFTFANEGDENLRLTAVEPSCGCTTPEWSRSAIAPGETGTIKAIFDTEGRPGPFRKSIVVKTTGKPATTRLYIQGKVEYPDIKDGVTQGSVTFDNATVNLGAVPPNERLKAIFLLQNKGERPVQIEDAETPNNLVTAYFPDQPIFMDEVTKLRVAIRTYGMQPGQQFNYAVKLHTDDEKQPVKTLHVRGTVEEPESASATLN